MGKIKEDYPCSLELTMALVGGKWKLVILWHLINNTKRFSQLKRDMPSITQKMLTQQLRELEEVHIISRKVYPIVPPKVEYSMTDYGKSLIPILGQLCAWSSNYAKDYNIKI